MKAKCPEILIFTGGNDKMKYDFSDLEKQFTNIGKEYFAKQYIFFAIIPTEPFYDIVALGNDSVLKQLLDNNPDFHFIKNSKFGGLDILICDNCATLTEAYTILKDLRKKYAKST